jgi:MATE family multidrug resistance protein
MPLAIANASGTLVAQQIGAGDAAGAQRLGWHGVTIGVLVGATVGIAVYLLRDAIVHAYTGHAVIIGAALPLLTWVAVFHLADATQAVSAFVLRAYRIVTLPLVVNTVGLWGIGIGGGYLLAFDTSGRVPTALRGAPGFWAAATVAVVAAAVALLGLLVHTFRRHERLRAVALRA